MRKIELKFLKNSMMYVPEDGMVVEIGSWMGGSSEMLAKGIEKWCPTTHLICIDPFDSEYFKKTHGLRKKLEKNPVDVYDYFKKRMKPYEYELIRMKSEDAIEEFDGDWEFINFLFIDGNHEYKYVKQDIEMWIEKVKPSGGIMCGHDYGKYGVKKAVDEAFGSDVRFPADSIWMIIR